MISLAGDLEFRICRVWVLFESWITVEICLNFVPGVINGSTDQSTEATCQKGYSIHPPSFGHWLQRSGRDSCDGTVEPCFDFFLGFARMKVSILMDSEEGNPRARWFLEDLGHENLWETLRTLWWLSESFDFHMLRTQALIPIGFLGQILTGPGPGPIYGYGLPMWKNCKHVQDLRKLHVMRDLVGFQC